MEFKELIATFAAKYAIEGLDGVDDVVERRHDQTRVVGLVGGRPGHIHMLYQYEYILLQGPI